MELADKSSEFQIVYPVHLNPNIQKNAKRYLSNHQGIILIDPLPYDFLLWLDEQRYIIFDSGAFRKEALQS